MRYCSLDGAEVRQRRGRGAVAMRLLAVGEGAEARNGAARGDILGCEAREADMKRRH